MSAGLITVSFYVNCVTVSGGDAEGRRAGLAEGPGLCRKHFPSLWDVKSFSLVLLSCLVLFHRCDWSWTTETLFTTRGSSTHNELASQGLKCVSNIRFYDVILCINTMSFTQKWWFADTQMEETKSWSIFIFLHTIFSDPNSCWVMMHKTQKELVQDRVQNINTCSTVTFTFVTGCWVHWFCTVCLF